VVARRFLPQPAPRRVIRAFAASQERRFAKKALRKKGASQKKRFAKKALRNEGSFSGRRLRPFKPLKRREELNSERFLAGSQSSTGKK
jgi:hypothetical protein